jgi:V/A-type H+-transporting ATPase subunit E
MKPASSETPAALPSSGVEALIARLREEGVAKGRDEAGRIEAESRARAAQILRQAEAEAGRIVTAAQREASSLRTAGEDALKLAMRDAVLQLRAVLTREVNENVRRLITAHLKREEFLERLILEVARRGRDEAGAKPGEAMEIVLPRELIGIEELRRNPLELEEGSLSHFVLAVASEALQEGVTFSVADDDAAGIRICFKDRSLEIDLTDDKVAELILAHLQPRFRAILEGTVR